MFLEWIAHYIETPRLELSHEDEILFYCGIIGIIVIALIVISAIAIVIHFVRKFVDRIVEKIGEEKSNVPTNTSDKNS